MPISGARPDNNMIENMLVHTNPWHVRDEVTTSDYITMIILGVLLPLGAVYMQTWVDQWARGTPVKRGDPRYFVVSEGEDAAEQKKEQ
eukprot:COSAG02_NODE_811_length_16911_cov_343.583095_8_plen_88_part_00